jgi:hypothetical protein
VATEDSCILDKFSVIAEPLESTIDYVKNSDSCRQF